MKISLFFFGADSDREDKYRLLFDAVKFADTNGFHAVWVPERHFMRFGGLYGNPAVTAAALAAISTRLQIRAGSVVVPLHHPLEIAEAWSMIDHFSGGRAGIAVASGWHVDDFVLAPANFAERRRILIEHIGVVRRLWNGERVAFRNGEGVDTEVGILPRPLRPDIPIWLTAVSDEGCIAAAEQGFGVLTSNFNNQYSLDVLRRKIGVYRQRQQALRMAPGQVTLMMHAFVGESREAIAQRAAPAMAAYLRNVVEMQSAQDRGLGVDRGYGALDGRRLDTFLRLRSMANIHSELSFVGTHDDCVERALRLREAGVDEIACLIDFGPSYDDTMASLQRLADVIRSVN